MVQRTSKLRGTLPQTKSISGSYTSLEKNFPEITFPQKTLRQNYISPNVYFPERAFATNYISLNVHLPENAFS